MIMKTCKHCDVELVVGENIWKSTFNNKDYQCKLCHKKGVVKWLNDNPGRNYQFVKNHNYKIKGVYGIFSEGKCLYVGESKQLNGRITKHRHYIKHPDSKYIMGEGVREMYYQLQTYSNLVFGVIEETDNHKEREKYWIKKFQPVFNSDLVA